MKYKEIFSVENLDDYETFLDVIKNLRRSPKVGQIFTLYMFQQNRILKPTTRELHIKLFRVHLAGIETFRADRIEPLYFQEKVLRPLFNDEKYASLLAVTRLLMVILDFAKACKIIQDNPIKEIYTLPILKSAQRLMNRKLTHRSTLPFDNLRNELMRVIRTFHQQATLRRQLLLEIALRTILRPREVVSIRITNLDEHRKLLNVYSTKNLDCYVLHTPDSLGRCLKKAYSLFGSVEQGYIFASPRDRNKPLSPQTLNKALTDMGFQGVLCAHGIRSIASNFFAAHSDQIHPWTAEAMLQHSIGTKVSRAYRRDDYMNERIKAAIIWNKWLDGIYGQLRI